MEFIVTAICLCTRLNLQPRAEVVLRDQKGLFYLQISRETTPPDRPASTLYPYQESLVSSTTYAVHRSTDMQLCSALKVKHVATSFFSNNYCIAFFFTLKKRAALNLFRFIAGILWRPLKSFLSVLKTRRSISYITSDKKCAF